MPEASDKYHVCLGKRVFISYRDAKSALGHQRRRGRLVSNDNDSAGKLEPYRCRYCAKWHLGGNRGERQHKDLARYLQRYKERSEVIEA